MTAVSEGLAAVNLFQNILSALAALSLTAHYFPSNTETGDLRSLYDFIIVGGGTAGSVVASRLSEDKDVPILLVEAGTVPPLESMMAGLFTLLPNSKYDWNFTSTDDGHANQNLIDKVVPMTAGKMLGGSSCLDHLIHVRGVEYDYKIWEEKTGSGLWSYENLLPFFKKSENVLDETVLKYNSRFHGTEGPLKAAKQHSALNDPILDAFEELGHKNITDVNSYNILGYTEPLLNIAEGYRQSAAYAYMRQTKNRKNLHVKYNSHVTKIIIDSDNRATGVEFIDENGVKIIISAKKEVIISAGALNSPKLLMLSGIGPKDHLKSLGITNIANLPVGDNLIDHVTTVSAYTMGKTTSPVISNPLEFPAPMLAGYVGLDSDTVATYQSLPISFTQSSSGFLQMCSFVFKYDDDICQFIYNANEKNEIMLGLINLLHPKSRGKVRLVSKDHTVAPKIELGHLSHKDDLIALARSLMDFHSIVTTSYFESMNSTLVNLNLQNCKDLDLYTFDFWICYAKEMSATLWHYSSTCAIGSVLNSDLTVKGIENLRVIDASSMPDTISGNIKGSVYGVAEMGADMIKATYKCTLDVAEKL